jgi:hypothetical protein
MASSGQHTGGSPDRGVSLLRLSEGWTVSSPQRIVAQGTDWRSLYELKKELKG